MIGDLTPRQFLDRRAAGGAMTLLDVREDWESNLARSLAAPPYPHGPDRRAARRARPGATTVVICRSGGRSAEVARFLAAQGFGSVFNLAGGILAWSRDIDPKIPQY